MPNVDVRQQFSVTLTNDEFRLIGRALCQQLEHQVDKIEALRLNQSLCFLRAKHIRQCLEVAERAEEGAFKLLPPEVKAEVQALKDEKEKIA